MTVKRHEMNHKGLPEHDANGSFVLWEDYEDTVTNLTAQVQGLAVEMFNIGYQRGHSSTVDGYYVDIHQSDMATHHADIVSEILEEKDYNTDAALAEIRNSVVDDAVAAMASSGAQTFGDCIVAVNSLRKEQGK